MKTITHRDGAIWPPPTNDMTLAELKQADEVAQDFARHVHQAFLDKCKAQGHTWGQSYKDYATGYERVTRERMESDKGVTEDVPYSYQVWRRKCTICGVIQEREPKVNESNPFDT